MISKYIYIQVLEEMMEFFLSFRTTLFGRRRVFFTDILTNYDCFLLCQYSKETQEMGGSQVWKLMNRVPREGSQG
jgi:hypothetical protein